MNDLEFKEKITKICDDNNIHMMFGFDNAKYCSFHDLLDTYNKILSNFYSMGCIETDVYKEIYEREISKREYVLSEEEKLKYLLKFPEIYKKLNFEE